MKSVSKQYNKEQPRISSKLFGMFTTYTFTTEFWKKVTINKKMIKNTLKILLYDNGCERRAKQKDIPSRHAAKIVIDWLLNKALNAGASTNNAKEKPRNFCDSKLI